MNQVTTAPLFQPFNSPKLQLKNRLVMAPMTRNFSPGYCPGDDVVDYYRRRAENEVGLIITEGTTVPHAAANGYDGVPAFHGDALAGWKKVADAVHQAGGKIFPQLWHVGTVRKPGTMPHPDVPGMGPSGITSKGKRKAHAMTDSDIADVISAFAQAAADAHALGFDGIELHGAHGYLLDQFFWDVTNERTDRFGGSLEARLTFVLEIIKACRARVGDAFPLALRFSQWKQQDYAARLANSPDELASFLQPLSDAGVDLFHASTRRFWEPEFDGSDLNLAGWTRQITGKPAITVGSVGLTTDFIEAGLSPLGDGQTTVRQIDDLLERLARDEFDLVAVGRALLQDPAWAVKVRDGKFGEISDFSRDAIATLY